MFDSFFMRKQTHFDVCERAVLFLIELCESSSQLTRELHRLEYSVSSTRLSRHHTFIVVNTEMNKTDLNNFYLWVGKSEPELQRQTNLKVIKCSQSQSSPERRENVMQSCVLKVPKLLRIVMDSQTVEFDGCPSNWREHFFTGYLRRTCLSHSLQDDQHCVWKRLQTQRPWNGNHLPCNKVRVLFLAHVAL